MTFIINLLPIIAAVLLFASFIPLISKLIKHKSSAGMSILMMQLGLTQCIFFVIDDLYFKRYAMVAPFLILGVMYLITYFLILKYKHGK